MRRHVSETSWLRLMFRLARSREAQAFVSLPADGVTDNVAKILERLHDAERCHSALATGVGKIVK